MLRAQSTPTDLASCWEMLLQTMQNRIGHRDVEIWLTSAKPIQLDGSMLIVEVENQYYSDWITENYLDTLIQEASVLWERPIQIRFRWGGGVGETTAETDDVPEVQSDQEKRPPRGLGVNPDQRFSTFVVGECNKFAHAAAQAVADSPARNYNPLFIYGSTGLGKTHLMHAVANHILETVPGSRVVYVTAEDFMNEMINCLRYKRMEDFHAKYRRRATVLLVDDIQFLGGKDRTQEEFFHTFNALQTSGRQIILTSDVIPKDIAKLAPRLRTRFEGGLLADMQAPDRETLVAILLAKADGLSIHIPSDLADAIANAVEGNIRELEGVLKRLAAHYTWDKEPLTLGYARKKMPDVFRPAPTQLTVASIIEAVARFHSLRSADITGSKRTRTLTRPRHIAMYMARRHTNLSFPELGREFGGRDHSTIQHGCRKVEQRLREDADLRYKIRLIEQGLNIRAS